MVSERLIKLYYNKLKKPTIINGLVLHPFIVDDRIIWEVENPNDVSYSSTVVEGHLEEMLYEFLELAGVIIVKRFQVVLIGHNYQEIIVN